MVIRLRDTWKVLEENGTCVCVSACAHQALHDQMAASVQEISNLIEPVAIAARSEASHLGHKVHGFQTPNNSSLHVYVTCSIRCLCVCGGGGMCIYFSKKQL